MTTIVAVKSADKVVIGTDSKVTDGSGRWWSHPSTSKVVKRGEYLIAGSGEVAAGDIVLHIWNPPKPTVADKKDLYHFMVAKVIPSIKKCMKENDYKWEPAAGESDEGPKFNFLIALGGEVFEFSDDFGVVMRSSGIYGIGSGSDIALGVLLKGGTVEEALTIASEQDIYTAPPFKYFEQAVPKGK
jgi:ATP-dependent protease HslVU (ClpYQ) peptidase subunit